jgi:NAD(P)-dependent dehydrogenase (short-subunit alcohol dehydrogenase family)
MPPALAIVTGGAYEEGLSTAEALLQAGLRVSIWDEDPAKLDDARREMNDARFQPDVRRVDVADLNAVREAYAAVRASLGEVDALYNMATLKNTFMLGEHEGRSKETIPFWKLDLGKLKRAVDVNVLGTLYCSAVIAPDMVAAGRGLIVNFSTGLHTQRSVDHIPYGPSKALVDAFTLSAADQLRAYGVRVNAVASGGAVNRRASRDPKRQPYDWIAPIVRFLSSDAAKDVTGQTFTGGEEPVAHSQAK